MNMEELYKIYLQFPSVQTDTRKLKAGDIFFALKGANFNGNLFARQALDAGASFCVVDEDPGFSDERLIKTDDVLTTLQQLAKQHRLQFNIPFIAITGSNGKTTTKELIHAVLNSHYKTYTTEGNLNNHIGIPLTILKIKKDAEMAVIEMGANHQKEIAGYCTYALPTYGMITNIGKAHLEGFGGIEGVKKGKGELFDHLRANNGTAFVFRDADYFMDMSKGIKHITWYGTKDADYCGHLLESQPFLKLQVTKGAAIDTIQTQLVGAYNFPNVMAAVAIGKYFKVPDHKIKTAIEAYSPTNSRSQLIEKDGNKIVLDAYNANPSSMREAIINFAKLDGAEKVLMIGGMMELGEDSLKEHEDILKLIGSYQWKAVVLVGGDFSKLSHPYNFFSNSAEARDWYRQKTFRNCLFLIKGSRSMQMEKVLE